MLRDYYTIMDRVNDEDILTIYTIGGTCVRGHWYEDHVLRELCRVEGFTEIRPLVYHQNEVY